MARNRDIAGLLTGIPSNGFAENMMQMSRELGSRFGSGVTGMMTGDIRTPTQRLTGDIKNFQNLSEAEQRGLIGRLQARGETGIASQLRADLAESARQKQLQAQANLNLSNPEDLRTLAKMQQAAGDVSGAMASLNTAKQIEEKEKLKKGLLGIAKSQGDEEMITFIEAGGDLKTASTRLLSDKATTAMSTLTEDEKKEYQDYFDVISNEDLEKAGISTGIFSVFTQDRGVKNRLMYQAEQIYTNAVQEKRRLTRQEALLEAMNLLSSGSSGTTTPTNGPTPRGKQKDSFAGTPIKG